jgi:hypothetical protein
VLGSPGLGSFEIVARRRPVDLVAPAFTAVTADGPGAWDLPQPAPYTSAVARVPTSSTGGVSGTLALTSGEARLEVRLADDVIDLRVDAGGRTTHHRSRRFGRLDIPADGLAITLTGTHLTGLTRERGRWRARARYDLSGRLDTRDEEFCAGLCLDADGQVTDVRAGAFGQLGLRDVRLVSEADGTPVRDGRRLLITATHAGPGFFDAAHTGVWALDPDGWVPEHLCDLFFRRPDRQTRPGVYGDHATHLVRDGGRWLVATSTWGDFDGHTGRSRRSATVAATLAETDADLLAGQHVLDTRPLGLPTDGLRSVGVWDPHLVRIGGRWHVGFVSASRFFRFHPALAVGDDLDHLELRAADPTRTATEGTTLVRVDGDWVVLASDGRRGPRAHRAAYPVFDLALRQTGRLDAPYPTNIPWPTVVDTGRGWVMVTFDGTRVGGELVGYGSHGDLVVAQERRPQQLVS